MEVIWTRTIDTEASARAWRQLGLFGGIPAGVALAIALIFGGFWTFLGVLIVAAIVLALWASWVFFNQLGKRMNPTVSLDGNELVWARRRVPTGDVVLWSTFHTEASMSLADNQDASGHLGAIRFRLRDESESEFLWANLPDEDLESLKLAVAPHVTAPWTPDRFMDRDDPGPEAVATAAPSGRTTTRERSTVTRFIVGRGFRA